MKYALLLFTGFCFMAISCSDDYHIPHVEEEDHQKEYLQFLPVDWETNLLQSISSVRHSIQFSSNPLVYENILIVPLNKDGIVGLDQETGNLLWQKESYESGKFLDGWGVELIGDILLCKGYYSTIALNPLDGAVIWEQYFEPAYGHSHSIVTNGDQLYKVVQDEYGHDHIHKADISDGEWERIHSAEENDKIWVGGNSVAFRSGVKDYLLFLAKSECDNPNPTQTIHLLDVATRSIVWSDIFTSHCSSTNKIFIYDNKIIHFNNQKDVSNVRALNIKDGEEYWKVEVAKYHQPWPYVLNDFLYLQGVSNRKRIDLTTGTIQIFEDFSMGHTDMFERDGKIYYAGFFHFADVRYPTIGKKIAVVDKETMQLENTILPHHRENTTIGQKPYGQEVFDNEYSYVGYEMVFSQDGKRIFVSGNNEIICLQLEDERQVIHYSTL